MAHLCPKSTLIIYFQSALLFLHDKTFPSFNIKSGQSHLYKAVFYCRQVFYMYSSHYTAEAGQLYVQKIYEKTFQVMFTLIDTQLYKKCTRSRAGTRHKPKKVHRSSDGTCMIKDLLRPYKLSSFKW